MDWISLARKKSKNGGELLTKIILPKSIFPSKPTILRESLPNSKKSLKSNFFSVEKCVRQTSIKLLPIFLEQC